MSAGNDIYAVESDTIGTHLRAAMVWYHWAGIHYGAGDQVRAAREQGFAFGHAFRAAELAYDAGMARNVQGMKP